jgi:hypothetical protein
MSWKKGGYQEWLKAKEREYRTRAKQQFAFDILREKDSGKLHEASLQIASSHVGEFLADFDSTVLREKIQADPLNFVRLLNALSKLSESGIKCEAHRVEMAERCEAVRRSKLPPMELGLSKKSASTLHHIIKKMRQTNSQFWFSRNLHGVAFHVQGCASLRSGCARMCANVQSMCSQVHSMCGGCAVKCSYVQ